MIASHRPLGLADPCLSLLSDILHMRLNITIAAFVGPNQQGGQTDPRYLIIRQSDVKGIRIQMGLPTVESSADARFGFDGGRHSQVLAQLYIAGAKPHDWLLVRSLLCRYTMRIQVRTAQGDISYLPTIEPKGGGMVQGLSMSSPLYTLLPRKLQERTADLLPDVAIKVHPQLLQIYRATRTGQEADLRPVTAQDIQHHAWRMECIIPHDQEQQWTDHQCGQVTNIMRACRTDAERLLLLDWASMAHWGHAAGRHTASLGPIFFIDDSRLTTSSQEAAITAMRVTSDYAVATGVVFETKKNSKSTMAVTPQEEMHPALQTAVQGCWEEPQPSHVTRSS